MFLPRVSRLLIVLLSLLAITSAALSASFPVESRPQPFGPGDRFIYPLAARMTIDGVFTECKGQPPTLAITRETVLKVGTVNATIDSDADASVNIWMAYTSEGLYVYGEVRDDILLGGAQGKDWAQLGTFGYDTLLVSILGGQKAQTGVSRETYLAMTHYEAGGAPRPQAAGNYVAVRIPGGYCVEGFLPFTRLAWKPRAGDWMQFYVILVDQDRAQGATGPLNFGQLLYNDAILPRLRLLATGSSWGGDLSADRERLTVDYPLYLTGSIDALKPGGMVRDIKILDQGEAVVFQQKLAVPLAGGQRTRVGLDLSQVKLAPGKYTAIISFGGEGKGVVQAQTAFEIAPPEKIEAPAPGASQRFLRFYMPEDPPPYTPLKLTKDDYWKLARELWPHKHFNINIDDSANVKGRDYGLFTSTYMLDFVLLYKLTGNPGYARVAIETMKFLDETTREGKKLAEQYRATDLVQMYLLMKGSKDFPLEEDKRWRELIVREAQHTWSAKDHQGGIFEYGNNNRGFWYLFRYAVALKFNPDIPEAKIWKPYIDKMLPYYMKIKDVDENTTGYGLGDGWEVVCFMRAMDMYDDYFKDPEARYYHGRFAHELSPFGDLAAYGDGASFGGSPILIPQFEQMATVTRDGRYKWIAHRALEYLLRFKLDTLDYCDSQFYLTPLLWACYYADETVSEVQPEWGSELLTRKKYVMGDFNKAFYWYMDENVSMPSKMVLRSGWKPDDLFAMVECAPGGGHAPAMPGAVCYMSKDRSVLLSANPYGQRSSQNVIYLKDRAGMGDQTDEEISVPLFADNPLTTIGRIKIAGYQRLPATEDRIILFVKNRFLVVKDRVGFQEAGLYDVTSNWQTQNVGLQTGMNWANTYFSVIENWSHLPAKYRTYDRDLLIYATPQPQRQMKVVNQQSLRVDMFTPISVAQQWSGRVRAGDLVHFTTILWPHKAQADVQGLVGNIKIIEDTPDRTVLEIKSQEKDGNGNPQPCTTLVAHNETGGMFELKFETATIRTDARYCIIQRMPDAPGLSLTAVEATTVALGGNTLYQNAQRGNFDKRL
ncbi:MAG: DOMON domain-containing protein [Armatimonadota bacterium]